MGLMPANLARHNKTIFGSRLEEIQSFTRESFFRKLSLLAYNKKRNEFWKKKK